MDGTMSENPAQWLKITEKVSFNILSEASYVYILSGQKFIKNAKIEKFKWDILGDFQTLCWAEMMAESLSNLTWNCLPVNPEVIESI